MSKLKGEKTRWLFNRLISYVIIKVSKDYMLVKSRYESGDETESSYKIRTMDDVCDLIKAGKSLNLDGCYIKDFSYPRIQQECGDSTILRGFSACEAFFDGDTDFSKAIFEIGEKDFRKTRFGKGVVDFSDAQFNEGDVRFDETHFGEGRVSFSRARFGKGNIFFIEAQFNNEDISFKHANFEEGHFYFVHILFCKGGKLSFRYTKFGVGDVYFSSTRFGLMHIDFEHAQFGSGVVKFVNARFGAGVVSFRSTNFGEGSVDFVFAQFNERRIEFHSTRFGKGKVLFNGALFSAGGVSFSGASFGAWMISFCFARFEEGIITFSDADFSDSKLNFSLIEAPHATLRFVHCSFYQHSDLRGSDLGKLEIIDCILERTFLLTDTRNQSTKIRRLSLLNSKNEGTIYLDWETARNGIHSYEKVELFKHMRSFLRVYSRWLKTKPTSCQNVLELKICKKLLFWKKRRQALIPFYKQQSKQFQMLKENFHHIGEYDHEDESFVEYMRSYRQTQSTPLRFGLWLLDMIGEYGTKPRRLSCWMGGMVLVFGVIYGILLNWQAALEDKSTFFSIGKELASKTLPDFLEHIIHGFYISAITFLTIGDNDISSRHFFSATLITAEGFFGLFLMSYFIVSLVRKTLR